MQDKSATDKIVRWANWPYYLDFDDKTKKYPTLEKFQQQTGIKATYTADIDDNDTYYGKVQGQLKNGDDIGADIIVLTDWMAARLIRQGYVQKLDQANIPNMKNLDPQAEHRRLRPGPQPLADRGRAASPASATTKDKVGRELKTVDDLWAPDLKGKIEVLSEMRDTIGLLMLAQGVDISKDSPRTSSTRRSTCSRSRSTPARSARSRATPTSTTSRTATRSPHRLVRRHPRGGLREGRPELQLHDPGDRRHTVVGQHDDPDRVTAQGERRDI